MKWNKKLKFGVFCTMLEGFLSSCNFVVLFLIMRVLKDGNVPFSDLLKATGVLAVIYILRLIVYSIGYVEGQIGGAAVSKDIRVALGNKMKNIPLSRFTQGQIGQYINIVTSDVGNYQKILTHKAGELAKNITLSILLIIFAATIYLPAGLILLVTDFLMIPALWMSFYMVKKYGNQKNTICAEAVSSIVEYIAGIQTFRAYGAGGIKNKTTTKAMKDYSNISFVYESKVIPIGTILNMLICCSLPLVIWVSSVPWIEGNLETVPFVLISMLPLLLSKLSSAIFIDLTSYKNLEISKQKIQTIFREREEQGSMEAFEPDNHEIKMENVDFSYVKGEPVLKQVSFCAPDQKLTAIVGDSGSGKSTILNLVSKFYDADNGSITIGGKSIQKAAPERVLEQISTVEQDVFLFNDTIRNNIRHARPDATDKEIEEACKEANCDTFIRKMEKGYDTMCGENGTLLSGGERQRISIARAILKDSPILLLDEATASLDIENELAVKEAIANLLKRKKTVIMIAHTLSIVKHADKIIVVSGGKVVESGTHDELLCRKGKYAAMWNAENLLAVQ